MGTAADVKRPMRGIISARRAPRDPWERGPHVRGGDHSVSRLSIKRLLVSERQLSRWTVWFIAVLKHANVLLVHVNTWITGKCRLFLHIHISIPSSLFFTLVFLFV